jgi:signal transduction histidine kinase
MTMHARPFRSASLPVTIGAGTALLTIALLVGWTVILVHSEAFARKLASSTWLLVLGLVAFAVILAMLGLLLFFILREIREVRAKDQFIDSVTHELRSPLASLQLALETLARPELSDEQRGAMLAMMQEDVTRLSTFIDDVLTASRIAAGRWSSRIAEVSLAELTARARDATLRRYALPPHAIEAAIPTTLHLRTDPTSLEIVLRNLLDNAVKYSDASSEPVRVDATEDAPAREIRIEVTDSGIGLARSDLRRIFRRFHRVEREAVRARHGTGLGLFVAAELARKLGGRVSARSHGEGRGATFTITLPATSETRGAS